MKPLCRHCQKKPANRGRGLCWACYYTPGVKELYPVAAKNRKDRGEATEAELDALIAERRPTMPNEEAGASNERSEQQHQSERLPTIRVFHNPKRRPDVW